MKKLIIGVAGAAMIAFGVFSFATSQKQETVNNITTAELKQMVEDFSTGKRTEPTVFITSHQLTIKDDKSNETVYDLPKDEFFVSIAPYINFTHPCATHYLSSCRGEMVNEEFDIHITDRDGTVIMDQKIKSLPNGFIDLWVPRNKHLNVKISYNGKSAEAEIPTFEGDDTCVTTMKLV